MKTRRERGFTLIEVLIVIVTGAIVVLAAGSVLVTSQVAWNNAWEKADLQREASYAMQRMSRIIKSGTAAEVKVEGDSKSLRIKKDGTWIRFFAVPGTNDLTCQSEGGDGETIIDGIVTDLEFNVVGNIVTIALELRKGNFHTGLVTTVMMRNYGG